KDKLDRAKALGLDEGIETADQSFRGQLAAPVDVIVDPIGGPAFADNLAALALRGRLVMIGFLQGPDFHGSLEMILRKRLEVIGTVMRTRQLPERAALVAEFAERVLPTLGTGLRPVLGGTFPAEQIAQAHQAMEKNAVFGKIVVTW
ncbi:MAG: zinc-binding dehydrogenase, partial [Gemmatimonadota bacterium]